MASTAELVKRIEFLEKKLGAMVGRAPKPSDDPKDRPDYVEPGGAQHAAMLGLIKADEGAKLAIEGWTIEDITQHGSTASDDYLKQILKQKVSELVSQLQPTQSHDPRLPFFAPPMWTPSIPLSKITE